MVEKAVDPLTFAIDRAEARFDFASVEEARQAAELVLGVLARVPSRTGGGLDLKVAKALDTLSRKLSMPVHDLKRRLGQLRARTGRARQVSISIPTALRPTSKSRRRALRSGWPTSTRSIANSSRSS